MGGEKGSYADFIGNADMTVGGGKRVLNFAEAKGYNLPFGEEKRLRRCFVRSKDLGDALWDEIRTEYNEGRNKPSKSFEGRKAF